MSLIHYTKQPSALRDPVAIVALGGWNDAADSATTALKFLVELWKPLKIAEIDTEDFYVFTETRPTVKIVDGLPRRLSWPNTQFLAYSNPDFTRDVIIVIGVEPQLKWKTYSHIFIEACKRFTVSEVVLLGALLADIPHSISVPITGTSSDDTLMERLREMDVHASRYEGPTGMIGVLHDACQHAHIPSASFWAAAPHYLAATPNIKVTTALLTYLNTFLSFGLDLSALQADSVRFEEQITTLVERDPEAKAYVQKLEEQLSEQDWDEDTEDEDDEDEGNEEPRLDSGPLPSADTLIRGVEELLRKQRENGHNQDSSDDADEDDEENE